MPAKRRSQTAPTSLQPNVVGSTWQDVASEWQELAAEYSNRARAVLPAFVPVIKATLSPMMLVLAVPAHVGKDGVERTTQGF